MDSIWPPIEERSAGSAFAAGPAEPFLDPPTTRRRTADSATSKTATDPVRGAVILFCLAFLVYFANGREISSTDTIPAKWIPYAMARGDGPVLDRFEAVLRSPEGMLPYFAAESRGHIVSVYPPGTTLLGIVLMGPQIWLLDRVWLGWDEDAGRRYFLLGLMAKNAAAALAAFTAVALYFVLRAVTPRAGRGWALLAAALGSEMWTVSSQTLWPNGAAALALAGALLPWGNLHVNRRRLVLHGLIIGSLPWCRLTTAPMVVALLLAAAWQFGRRSTWTLAATGAMAATLTAHNVFWFGTLTGGTGKLEGDQAMHQTLHGVMGAWTGDLLAGLAGTLFSPSRGLFIFCPWVAMALLLLPTRWQGLRKDPRLLALLIALPAYLLLVSKYAVWWGGWSFGPRYWTEWTPFFAVLLAIVWGMSQPTLTWHLAARRVLLAIGVLIAVTIQSVGAWCSPGSWPTSPRNIDLDHARLWDWHDNELARSLCDGIHPDTWRIFRSPQP